MTYSCNVIKDGRAIYNAIRVELTERATGVGIISVDGSFTIDNPFPHPSAGETYELERKDGETCEILTSQVFQASSGSVHVTFHAQGPFRPTETPKNT